MRHHCAVEILTMLGFKARHHLADSRAMVICQCDIISALGQQAVQQIQRLLGN